jgi:hypothetical protein
MWWRWTIFITCGIMIAACIISTTIDWIKGKTGPFGPKPEDWWGCGIFTIILAAVMFWIGRYLFMK